MDNLKPWLIVEVIHPELLPTRLARRIPTTDIDGLLFPAGFATAGHDKSLPYPARYPLIVYSWRAEAHTAVRPATAKKTRARSLTYAEARDRSVALRKAAMWSRPRVACAELG